MCPDSGKTHWDLLWEYACSWGSIRRQAEPRLRQPGLRRRGLRNQEQPGSWGRRAGGAVDDSWSVPGSRMKRVGGVVDDSRCAPRLDETRGRRTFGGLQIRLRVWGVANRLGDLRTW